MRALGGGSARRRRLQCRVQSYDLFPGCFAFVCVCVCVLCSNRFWIDARRDLRCAATHDACWRWRGRVCVLLVCACFACVCVCVVGCGWACLISKGERENVGRESRMETVRNGDERERQFTACERRESCGAGRGCGAEFTCVRRESVRWRGGTYEGPNLGVPANGESLCTRRAFYLKRVSRHLSLHHTAQAHKAPPASS